MSDREFNEENENGKPKFKIVDRRRLLDDSEEEVKEPADTAAPEKSDEVKKEIQSETNAVSAQDESAEDSPESAQGELDPFDYPAVVLSVLQTIVSIVWVHLGLVPNPQTNMIVKKLEHARKLITLFESILVNIQKDFSPEIIGELSRLLQEMKAQYVNQL